MKKCCYLILALFVFAWCGRRQSSIEIDRKYEDGIEVVWNHLQPYQVPKEPSRLALEKEYVIDAERPELLEAGLADIGRFDVNSRGHIYLIQHARKNEDLIFEFDERGQFLRSFGRSGEGPGEIQFPSYFGINSQDNVVVFDRGRNKLMVFGAAGNLISETILPKARSGCIHLENGNFIASEAPDDRPGEDMTEVSMSLFDEEFEKIKTFSRYQIASEPERADKISVYPPYPVGAVTTSNIFIGLAGREYEILVYDLDGNLLRKIRKEFTPVSVTEEFRKEILDRAPKGNPIIERIYFPEKKPAFQYLFTDENKRLFVVTSEVDQATGQNICDIFTKDGIFICRAPLGYFDIIRNFWEGLRLDIIARTGRVYALREKENGYKELVVFKAIWR